MTEAVTHIAASALAEATEHANQCTVASHPEAFRYTSEARLAGYCREQLPSSDVFSGATGHRDVWRGGGGGGTYPRLENYQVRSI